jgi:hypothetical protein
MPSLPWDREMLYLQRERVSRAASVGGLVIDRSFCSPGVTPSRLPRLRRNAGVTVQQLGSHAGVTAQPNGCYTVSAGAVQTGDRIANED